MLTASWLVDMIKMHTAKSWHWVKMVPWKRIELLFDSSKALPETGRKKQLCFVTSAAVLYYTNYRMVQALKKRKSIARGSIHVCVQGHLLPCPAVTGLCLHIVFSSCIKTLQVHPNPEKFRSAGWFMTHFLWMEICSQMKFQESKLRPTFLTQEITKPCKPHLELQQPLQGLLIKEFRKQWYMNNSHPLCPPHQNAEQNSSEGAAGTTHSPPSLPSYLQSTSAALDASMSIQEDPVWVMVTRVLLPAGMCVCSSAGCLAHPEPCRGSARLFILHSFSPQTDVSSPQGLWGVVRRRMAMSIWYTSLWEMYRLLQFPVWQSSQK